MTLSDQEGTVSTGGPLLLGFDIGGTKCCVVLGSLEGELLARRVFPTKVERGPEAVIEQLVSTARDLRDDSNGVGACGVAIGGPLDVTRGVIENPPNLPGWDAVPLRDILEAELGCPVGVEHDAAACALAESTWGHGRGSSRTLYLTCGTGFGMGLVIEGEPYYGSDGRPPEIGHVRLRQDGPVAFGKKGSVEAFCAASALAGIASWRFPERWLEAPTPEEVAVLAGRGDQDALRVIEINACAVGEVCAMLGDVLRPDLIVLGSLARYLGESWLSHVRAAFEREALSSVISACRISPSQLAERLQPLSAIVAAKRALESNRRRRG